MELKIGDVWVGDGHPCYVIAEIGINHNGSLELAKQLIDVAVDCGAQAVKFQKRTLEIVYSPEELAKPRESPFGSTNGDLKRALEFGKAQYDEIDAYCKGRGIHWFASAWDVPSLEFIEQYAPPAHKVASALVTHADLLRAVRETARPVIMSTGMSTLEEIDQALEIAGTQKMVLLHCTSTYPARPHELNLKCIQTLRERYGLLVGYSGHEVGLYPSALAAGLGACVIERHITLDRAMWGSDQAASIEPQGLQRLIRDIRETPVVMGTGEKVVYEAERAVREKLRRYSDGGRREEDIKPVRV